MQKEIDFRHIKLKKEILELKKNSWSDEHVDLIVDLIIKREDSLHNVIQNEINQRISDMTIIGNLKIKLNIAKEALMKITSTEIYHQSEDIKTAIMALKEIGTDFPEKRCGLIGCKCGGIKNHERKENESTGL